MNPPKPSSDPYVAARREWNEIYGTYISRERAWRITALVAIGLAIILAIGLIVRAGQNRFVPYVVKVDDLGRAQFGGFIAETSVPDLNLLKSSISRTVVNLRTVSPDIAILKRMSSEAFAYIADGSKAFNFLQDYYKNEDNNPVARARREFVIAEIDSVLGVSSASNTWQIEWTEKIHDRSGALKRKARFSAIVSIIFSPPKSEQLAMNNPLGIYFNELSWSEITLK